MHIYDIKRFVSKLTWLKASNAFKLLSSFYASRVNNQIQPWGLPMTLSVEPTTACNLRCPECPSGLRSFTRPTGTLAPELFEKIIDHTYKKLIYLIFYFQGEPYIHPSFLHMVRYAHEKNIYTITSTNGHFLNDANAEATVRSGLDRLIISVDGTSQEVYEQYRIGGKLENVLQGASNVVRWKKKLGSRTPHIVFQFLVVRPNEHQVPDIHRLAKELSIDEVKIKTAQLYDYKNGHELMPLQSNFSRYRKMEDGSYALKNTIKNECWKLWHASLMTWDGQILPCCFDKDAQFPMGQIKESSFTDIWKSAPYKDFRNKMKKGRGQIEICQNCSEGCNIWA